MANIEEQPLGTGAVIEAETFRDSVATIEQSGTRKWVYPKKPKGKFTNYRDLVTLFISHFLYPSVYKIKWKPISQNQYY
jgi:hypothetical protein